MPKLTTEYFYYYIILVYKLEIGETLIAPPYSPRAQVNLFKLSLTNSVISTGRTM